MSEVPLSTGQYGALVVTMVLSSVLSIAGSIAIVRISCLKLSSTYQRYLFALSIANIVNCFFLLIHNFLVPKDPNYPWAAGNNKSCTAMGFFLHFGALLVAFYNCSLAVYFFFSIQSSPKRQKDPEDVVGFAERMSHILCWVMPTAIAASAAGIGSISFSDRIDLCIILDDECSGPNEPGCVAGRHDEVYVTETTLILQYIFQVCLLVASSLAIAATGTVYCRVRSTFQRGREYGTDGDISDDAKQRLSAVSVQSLLYTLMFVNSFLWPVVTMASSGTGSGAYFAFQYLAFLLYPLQGALNCLIYIRPRFQMLTVMYPRDSTFVVLRVALSTAGDPDEIEHVRGQIYGEDYESPSMDSSDHSYDSELPNEVEFDPNRPMSATSLVSMPNDDDNLDPEEQKETKEEKDSN